MTTKRTGKSMTRDRDDPPAAALDARSGRKVSVGIAVTGNGYNGSGTMIFDLADAHITRLLFTP